MNQNTTVSRVITFIAVPPEGDKQEQQIFTDLPETPKDLSIWRAKKQLEKSGYQDIEYQSSEIKEHE